LPGDNTKLILIGRQMAPQIRTRYASFSRPGMTSNIYQFPQNRGATRKRTAFHQRLPAIGEFPSSTPPRQDHTQGRPFLGGAELLMARKSPRKKGGFHNHRRHNAFFSLLTLPEGLSSQPPLEGEGRLKGFARKNRPPLAAFGHDKGPCFVSQEFH